MVGQVWRFGDCEFDELRRELRVHGVPAEVEVKPLEVLHQLLLHAGEVVTKEELLESVWPGLMVVDGSLATAVSKLRKALNGNDSINESIIVTLPRVGYRLGVPVQTRTAGPAAWPELDLQPGQPVPGRDRWRLTRRLDLSPSSEVWLGQHPKTHEARVFKFASDVSRLKSLKREVTVGRLLHGSLGDRPEFVRIFEWNFDCHPYFVESEYGGPNLAEWAEMQGGLSAVPMDVRLRLLVDVAMAVAAAHAVDVLHKDLKPANILVAPGTNGERQIKIADFGSASLLEPARLGALGITNLGFTHAGTRSLTGSVMYVAPEVLAGESPTPASDVYALGVLLYQLAAGDFRRPLSPGWEAEIADPVIREDIAEAACGDPARRLKSAAQLAERLLNVDRRRIERDELAGAERLAQVAERRRAAARARRPWLVLAAFVPLATAAVSLLLYRNASPVNAIASTVAVLPFQNTGSDASIDYLRLALPDEIATLLSRVRTLSVRSSRVASPYGGANLDVRRAGREMRVGSIVTGHFMRAGAQLHITLEAIDVDTASVLWRDRFESPADDLMAVRRQIAGRARDGLVPALGASATDNPPQPKNEEAYDLFLRSLAVPSDPVPNKQAMAMLERAVALDATYPPAWHALARTYYVEARYGSGGTAYMDRVDAALERATTLDPGFIAASTEMVGTRVERGDLVGGYRQAEALVRRRPDNADSHRALSYVLRFAGLLEESSGACESAFLADRYASTALRACAVTFIHRGNFRRAMDYIDLDAGSDFAKALTIHVHVAQNKETDALQIGRPDIPQWRSYNMLLACVERRPSSEILALAGAVRPSTDPETNYFSAAHLAYCGQTDAALEMLTRAVKGNYCSYPAIDSDNFFRSVRATPRFREIRAAGVACQNNFLAARALLAQ